MWYVLYLERMGFSTGFCADLFASTLWLGVLSFNLVTVAFYIPLSCSYTFLLLFKSFYSFYPCLSTSYNSILWERIVFFQSYLFSLNLHPNEKKNKYVFLSSNEWRNHKQKNTGFMSDCHFVELWRAKWLIKKLSDTVDVKTPCERSLFELYSTSGMVWEYEQSAG